jgi:hypothetical protein
MIRAAATGRIDYSKAESGSYVWRLREWLMLEETDRDALITFTMFKQLQQVATAGGPSPVDGKAELFTQHYERGNAHLQTLGQALFPYMKWDEKSYYKSELEGMRAEYVAKFGDPSTPEAKAQAKRDMEASKRQQLMNEQKVKAAAEAESRRGKEIERLRSQRTARKGR